MFVKLSDLPSTRGGNTALGGLMLVEVSCYKFSVRIIAQHRQQRSEQTT